MPRAHSARVWLVMEVGKPYAYQEFRWYPPEVLRELAIESV